MHWIQKKKVSLKNENRNHQQTALLEVVFWKMRQKPALTEHMESSGKTMKNSNKIWEYKANQNKQKRWRKEKSHTNKWMSSGQTNTHRENKIKQKKKEKYENPYSLLLKHSSNVCCERLVRHFVFAQWKCSLRMKRKPLLLSPSLSSSSFLLFLFFSGCVSVC